ncbi:hypothetical protein A3860_30020 [Niastella vici]|uniref:Linalool dehydratase/isomerase domain-containing protein n=2 Tax=Niastella vici TaxID=1703345 RepID=A0A1V9FUL4_9BACT|nr:hypothetical protein A3860_30020 [Niastella vici]
MPDLPRPLHVIDYRQLALRFDSTVFDFNATDSCWPLVWKDSSGRNFPQPVVGLYTAIGDVRQGPTNNKGMFHEAVATMGSVLGASLVDIDKTNRQGLNYVSMLKNYFNKDAGWNIMMNNTCPQVGMLGGGYGRDWWYDVFPNVLFYAIYDKYPHEPGLDTLARSIAEKFCRADSVLQGNYEYSFFDYARMIPVKSSLCVQPDAAAGQAWVLYAAYKKFGDSRYLKAAVNALRSLGKVKFNPNYEVLMPFAAYLAARMNAELGENFNLQKMLDWTFDGTAACREGWGVLVGNWNGIDISGIVGSTTDHGGYGFLMNTYDAALPLLPIVRYNKAYAAAIGKWMLNAANACRFFYPQYMPKEHQTIPHLAHIARGVIGYEGIIHTSGYSQYAGLLAPVAQGDGPQWVPGKNPEVSQLSVYGSAHAGIFGSIIHNTNVAGILQLDLLATDFFHDEAYPTCLLYNPYNESREVELLLGNGKKLDLYNTISEAYMAHGVSGATRVRLSPRQAVVLVCVPSGGKTTYSGSKMLVNGIVVDYNFHK